MIREREREREREKTFICLVTNVSRVKITIHMQSTTDKTTRQEARKGYKPIEVWLS